VIGTPHGVLVLGGTQDARELAGALVTDASLRVVSSLAGRTNTPLLPPGEVRVGGFGGADGLLTYLQTQGIAAVIDATHPFAARMSGNAVAACAAAHVPLVVLERPPWQARPDDRFIDVPDATTAAEVAAATGRRIFVTVGRQELAPFARVANRFVLVRCIDAPDPMTLPPHGELVLARGPFAYADELALMRTHTIDCIVAKNSGGTATYAKIDAARTLGIPVVMIARPARARNVSSVVAVASAARWVRAMLASGAVAR